jgi:maltose/moltooligosaccharide transporter
MPRALPSLSFSQIINMNVGFFGIQYSFGLQQTAINPLYTFLHARPEELPLLNLAGPVTGLLVQPIIGAMSDRTWHPRWGRRKPYFLVGAVLCSLALLAFPFSRELWMAVGLLWILDAGNNTAMEPYRAFIADRLPPAQRATGFLTQSFFTGLGITLANFSLFLFQKYIVGGTVAADGTAGIPYWVFGSFFFGALCSIGSVLWSMSTTPEIPPTEDELRELRARPSGILAPLREIASAVADMPRALWQLALVYLFQWYAMFCYWQYISHAIARSVWGIRSEDNPALYQEAVGWTGLVNGWYNVVTFLSAFALARLARRHSARVVHACCLILSALALLTLPYISNRYLLFLPMVGFGIGWASMMGVPYLMVVSVVPRERYGVYMGIVNMMIVIPMIIQTLTFGPLYERLLGGDPLHVMSFAGGLLALAALAVMRIRIPEGAGEEPVLPAGPGH